MKNITANITLLNKAIAKGFKINNEESFESNVDSAKDFIMQNINKYRYFLIEADTLGDKSDYMKFQLPIFGHNQVDGELGYDSDKKRYEHMSLDEDGQLYLIIAYKNR